MRVAVSSQRRADAEVVENALEKIRRLDAAATITREGGQTILGCVGELHLDQVLRDLRRAVGVEVVVGEPIVGIREGVASVATGGRRAAAVEPRARGGRRGRGCSGGGGRHG